MSVTDRKKYKIKRSNKPLINYLLSFGLIIIMIIISLPKMAFAQIMSLGSGQLVSGISNARVKLPNTEYTESTIDLRVKVLGGEIKLKRTWVNGRWYLNTAWADLRFVADPLDNTIKTIDRAGVLYLRTGDANLYSFDQVYIKKIDTGWRWYDRQGNWITYDIAGRVTEYGDRNNIKVTFVLDAEGRRTAIKDHHGDMVYTFTYDSQERLVSVQDREGRTVNYQWQNDRLIKVTDVLGNDWLYGYDSKGQLAQRTEPDGGVIKLSYNDSIIAPSPAMVSGKNAGKIEQSSVITTGAANKDTKVARVGKITDKTGAVTVWNTQYDRTTKQYTVTTDDPQGKKTVAVFDKDGKKLSSTVNGVLQQTFKRDTKNNSLAIIDQRGLITSVQYDQAQHPIKITYPNGASEYFAYDNALQQIVSYTNALGVITTWQYDTQGNPTKIIQAVGKPEQRIISQTYDNYGQPDTITYGEGDTAITIKANYDQQGNITSYVDGNDHTYQYSYNSQGQLTTATNPLNATWKISYDVAGHITQTNDPLGYTTDYSTDTMGRTTKIVNPLGYSTNYSYHFNNKGWQITKTDALNQTTTYDYDTLGRIIKTTSPSGLETQQSYDQEGRFKQQIDPAGNSFSLEYGSKGSGLEGLVVNAKYPTFTESYNYSTLGLITEINQTLTDNEKLLTRISYDQQGSPISFIDPANRTSQLQYNALAEQKKHTDPLGNETYQTWDVLGNVTSVVDAEGHQYNFAYDKNSNLTQETKALGNDVIYRYDVANQLIEQQDTVGNIVSYQYDLAGRLVTEKYSKLGQTNPSQTVTYQYNQANQLFQVTQAGDTNSQFNYTLDELGRVTKTIITYGKSNNKITKTLQYSYTPENNLASITYPDNTIASYSYQQGLLKKMVQPNGETITWDNYQWGLAQTINFPNAVQNYQYDALQRLLDIAVQTNNKTLMKRQYSYDKAGNITQINTEAGNKAYQYDLLDRLTSAVPDQQLQLQGLPVEGYAYDAIGNRLGSTHQAGEWYYNDNNQLIQWGQDNNKTTLTYTANGNVAKEVKANKELLYIYNTADRLTTVKQADIDIASYQYDPYGRRISKTASGTTTYYLYTDEGLIAELDEQGNLKVAYGWQPDTVFGASPLWQANLTVGNTLVTANYNYLHTDHLGTAQIATNSNGEVTWKGIAEAFGKTQLDITNQITMNLRFPGQYYDQETGAHYNYFRDYNPNIGRYNESDPLGLNGDINTSVYVYNNPLVWLDPYGLRAQLTCLGPLCFITFPPSFPGPSFPNSGNNGYPMADPLGGNLGFPSSGGSLTGGSSGGFPSYDDMCRDYIFIPIAKGLLWILMPSTGNSDSGNLPETREDLYKDLTDKGFKPSKGGTSNGGYDVWKGADGTKVTIKPSGEVIRTQNVWNKDKTKKYPERQDYNGNRLPDQSHSTGHFVK